MIEKSPVSPPVMPKKSQVGTFSNSDFVGVFFGGAWGFLFFFGGGDGIYIYMAWMMMMMMKMMISPKEQRDIPPLHRHSFRK